MIYAFMQVRFILMRLEIDWDKPIAPNRRENGRGLYCFETFTEALEAAEVDNKNRAADAGAFLREDEKSKVVGIEADWHKDTHALYWREFPQARELKNPGKLIELEQ